MKKWKIVIDTNIIVAAIRSSRGASYRLLNNIDSPKFETNVSVPLILEYEAACRNTKNECSISYDDIDAIIDYICLVSRHRKIHFLWRPFLRDPKDDMVLELAVSAECEFIVTFNKKDFGGIGQFGLKAVTPKEFLEIIGEIL